MMFELVEPTERLARIRVAGVGGAGGNAVNRMIEAGLGGVDFIALNTDLQALGMSRAGQALQIGGETTRGLGSGGIPERGRQAVLEDESLVRDALAGSDMVFVTAGMGGGTGTGAAPLVAAIARELGALTVGVVTKPFLFEGRVRQRQAEDGLAELRDAVDTLIVIPNERLLEVAPNDLSMAEAFVFADNVLYQATRGIHDIIMKPHEVNLDFADVRSVMTGMGVALMGSGKATGEDRAREAAEQAINSPLLENTDIRGAKGVLVNLTGSDVGLQETNKVMSMVQAAAGDQAHIIFGYGLDETMGEDLQVTVIATGFDGAEEAKTELRGPEPRESREPQPGELLEMSAVAGDTGWRPGVTPPEPETGVECDPEPEVLAEEPEPAEATEPVAAPPVQSAEPAEEPAASETPTVSETAMRFTMVEKAPSSDLMPEPSPVPEPEAVPEPVEAAPPPSSDDALRIVEPVMTTRPKRNEGFMSDSLMDDLSEPAYTRKYMD